MIKKITEPIRKINKQKMSIEDWTRLFYICLLLGNTGQNSN